MVRQRQRNGEQAGAGGAEEHKSSGGGKRRAKSGGEKESGGRLFFSAGLVAVVAVAYFVWQGYMKTRSAKDMVTGLMWFLPRSVTQGSLGLRHWCEQGDDLKQWGWEKHDGRNFGVQKIKDRGVTLTTSFVKVAG